jgi:hypothetical protein
MTTTRKAAERTARKLISWLYRHTYSDVYENVVFPPRAGDRIARVLEATYLRGAAGMRNKRCSPRARG